MLARSLWVVSDADQLLSGSDIQVFRPLSNGSYGLDPEVDIGLDYRPDIAVGPDGEIVTINTNDTVSVFHPNGTLALNFGSHGSARGGFKQPADVAFAPDGRIVVAEPGNYSIRVFHPNGTPAFEFGSRGIGDGAFDTPYHVAVAPDG